MERHVPPADLTMADYQQPAKTDLLWVYEGVTAHVGYVLASRSGFWNAEQARDWWVAIGAKTASESGRTWRNLQDTADAVPVTMPATFTDYDWSSWTRGLDYYEEGSLIWLEAGAIISEQTRGRRTLDDFLAAFYGGPGGKAGVKTYTAQDVFDTLGRIAPYDWAGFFKTRLTSLSPLRSAASSAAAGASCTTRRRTHSSAPASACSRSDCKSVATASSPTSRVTVPPLLQGSCRA